MRTINPYSHIPFVHTQLMSFLTRDTFAWHLRRSIGQWLDYVLVGRPEDEDTDDYSRFFPVKALFVWVQENGGVRPEEFMEDSGYVDDKGEPLPPSVEPALSGVEQLAAYGLWLVDEEMGICGPSTEEDWDEKRHNPYGWSEVDVVNHKAECLLLAYQALSFIRRLHINSRLTNDEIEIAAKVNEALKKTRSEQASRGAAARHARDPKQVEKAFVFDCWKAWQAKPEMYPGPTAFARDMMEKCVALKSQKKIEDWCRDWRKQQAT